MIVDHLILIIDYSIKFIITGKLFFYYVVVLSRCEAKAARKWQENKVMKVDSEVLGTNSMRFQIARKKGWSYHGRRKLCMFK